MSTEGHLQTTVARIFRWRGEKQREETPKVGDPTHYTSGFLVKYQWNHRKKVHQGGEGARAILDGLQCKYTLKTLRKE